MIFASFGYVPRLAIFRIRRIMQYSIEKVATLIGAHRYGKVDSQIEWLLTDSRSLAYPETTLFFALRTRTGDGHRYIDDLYNRGVRNFVVSAVPWKAHDKAVADYEDPRHPSQGGKLYPDANFLEVVSPLKALQRLAERHRETYNVPVIGVTGSNGKTYVKEWIYQLLTPSQQVIRSPRSYNSQVGVPLSVWLLSEQSRVGIFEAGISQPGEMASLRAIIQPTIGVMTNIGGAHQENFASLEEKCLEKLSLFDDAQTLIYDADDAVISRCLSKSRFRGRAFGWSMTDAHAPLYITRAEKHGVSTIISFVYSDRSAAADGQPSAVEGEITIPFVDDASIQNAIHTLSVGLVLGLSVETITARMALLAPVAMRMEVKQGVRGLTIINDAYNSDLTGLDIALNFLERRSEGRRSVLVMSDIQQSGYTQADLYSRVADMVATRGVDMLVGIGPELCAEQHQFNCEKRFFATTEECLQSGLLSTFVRDVILLKGARDYHFEQLAEELELKVHETVLEVNLGALADNVRYYRSFMQPETRLTCMVKASAYGSGSVEVARTLQDLGVDYLAVAVADEGVELRKAGITMGIMIMNPEMTSFHTLFKYRLEPEIYSFRLLDAMIKAARSEGITNYPVHLKLDTGMCRLGFNPEKDIPALIDRLQHQQALRPRSVFSHFVGSDSEDFNEFSQQQYDRFVAATDQLQAAFPHHILRHICNTAGIARFPERHHDMCRLGLGLYGVDPITNAAIHNVATLRTTILQIREVPAGTSVGYSRRTIVDRPTRVAAIPIGYADGLDRHLGNRCGYALVNGKQAPYLGNICMDVCMLDVTDIDCKEGDSVEIFGDHLPVSTLSDLLGTIPYEILTSVSERVKRVYYQ